MEYILDGGRYSSLPAAVFCMQERHNEETWAGTWAFTGLWLQVHGLSTASPVSTPQLFQVAPSFSRTLLRGHGFRVAILFLVAGGSGGTRAFSEGGWPLLSVPFSLVGWRPWEVWPAGRHLHYLPQPVT